MFKWIARRPVERIGKYSKYGFVLMQHQYLECPRCKEQLNAGPNYQPLYCSECGQKLSFKGITYKADLELGYMQREGAMT